MDATKPYEFIGFGDMDATKPYKFIGFEAISFQIRLKIAQCPRRSSATSETDLAQDPVDPGPPQSCSEAHHRYHQTLRIYRVWGHGCHQTL